MFKDIKFIIGAFIIFTLLTIKEIPYINIVIKDKFWFIGIIFYLLFLILFVPSNFWEQYKRKSYLIVSFISTIFLLFIFTLLNLSIPSELFGIILYSLFWFLVIYKTFTYLKSSTKND